MFDDKNNSVRPTLVACLILLIVLAAVAVMSEETNSRHRAISGHVASAVPETAGSRFLDSLEPLGSRMAGSFPDDALVTYDIGIAPGAAADAMEVLLESSLPELHTWLRDILAEFQSATGLEPDIDFLPHLGHGLAVGLLPPEDTADGWPFPRKVVILQVLDSAAVSRFMEAWITWEAGAIAPMTKGVLGASLRSERVAGHDIVGLQLDGLLPVDFPLPSPSYVVAGGFLVMSPVRSAVAETVGRLDREDLTPAETVDGAVVEEVWLNFPAWPGAWQRAEPFVESLMNRLGVDSQFPVKYLGALVELIGEFQPGFGTTSITPEGGLVFRFVVDPPEQRTASTGM